MRLAFVFCVNDSLELSHDGDDAGFGGMDTAPSAFKSMRLRKKRTSASLTSMENHKVSLRQGRSSTVIALLESAFLTQGSMLE